MNHGIDATRMFAGQFIQSVDLKVSSPTKEAIHTQMLKAWVFPPMLSLAEAQVALFQMGIKVGAQNVHFEEKGAFTGEISVPMIKDLHIYLTLVGHSERRQYFGETNLTALKRADSHLKQGCKVVYCIGESKDERLADRTNEILKQQLDEGLNQEMGEALEDQRLVLAYEPVWAIGTGLTASPAQAEDAHHFIRQYIENRYGKKSSMKAVILYGGSVTTENFKALLECPNVDGGLVGGASLNPDSYAKLLEIAGSALRQS